MKGFTITLLGSAAAIMPVMAGAGLCADTADQPAQTAPAESGIREIIVTAQRRSENIQRVPISISAFAGDQLEKSNVKSMQDLTSLVSGYSGPGDVAFSSPHLRGVGSQISSPGLESSVATYVDGVYIGAVSPALLKLSDVAQIEVLKGPQGTLFGRNTTGGLVQVTTRDPGKTFEANIEAGYATFETITSSAYLNVPISDNVSTNLAAQVSGAGKGWGTNLGTGNPTYKLNSEVALRNKWDFNLGSGTRLRLMGDYEYHNDTNYFLSQNLPGQIVAPGYTTHATGWDSDAAADVKVQSKAWGLTGRLSHDFGFATLTDTLAYRDTSFNLLNFVSNYAPAPYDSIHFFWYTKNHQWTNELQLASNNTGAFKWTTGLFYYNATDINHQPAVSGPLGPPFNFVTDSRLNTSSIAVYAQGSYEITPKTTLTVGARYSNDKHTVNGAYVVSPAVFSFLNLTSTLPSFSKGSVAARISLAHRLTDDTLIYASYNRGTKSGGFNPVQINNPPFGDEKLDAYEVGTKIKFMDRKAQFNLAGFYYNYGNIQVQSFKNAGPPTVYNATSATLYGVDADFQFRPVSNLSIIASTSYVHSKFGDFPTAEFYGACDAAHVTSGQCTAPYAAGGGYYIYNANAKGFELPRAPKFTGSATVNYTVPVSFGKFDLSGTYSYNSGFYTTPGHELYQQAFSRVNASVQYSTEDERYYVRVWGSNLSNTHDVQQLNFLNSGPIALYNSPRTYGVTFGAKIR